MGSYEPKVLAFYYTWYGTPWGAGGDRWRGWDVGRHDPETVVDGRRDLPASVTPLAGAYDSLTRSTVRRHLREADRAGLDGFVVNWWGPEGSGDLEDPTVQRWLDRGLELLLEEAPDEFDVAVHHSMLPNGGGDDPESALVETLSTLLEEYATDPSWLTVDGRPVVFEYSNVLHVLEEFADDEESWTRLRERLRDRSHDPFVVGDTLHPTYLEAFDGLYRFAATLPLVEGRDLTDLYVGASESCDAEGALFGGVAHPGFDDRSIEETLHDREGSYHVPRDDGATYGRTWDAVERSGADWALVNTFNQWYEGSAIEPSREHGFDYIDVTAHRAASFREGRR
jgi:hypothetical protein